MSFSENLRNLRLSHNLTQVELAKKLNLSRSAISNYEQGKMQPSIETLIKISDIFEISIDNLIKSNFLKS